MGFNSELNRFYMRDRGVPGPGSYALNAFERLKNPRSHNKYMSAFGTYEKRFVSTDNKVPGPGWYKPERSV